jgi:hypothetical protein
MKSEQFFEKLTQRRKDAKKAAGVISDCGLTQIWFKCFLIAFSERY